MKSYLLLLASKSFQQFNHETQNAIYNEFYHLVYPHIFNLVKDHATTEDIIQDSFFKIIQKTPKYDNQKKFKAWFKVIAKNTTYNYLRKHSKTQCELDENLYLKYSNQFISCCSQSLEDEVESKMMIEEMEKYLNQIKSDYRILIDLRWKQELTYKEIAEKIHSTEEKVRQKLHRARKAVKKIFLKKWDFNK